MVYVLILAIIGTLSTLAHAMEQRDHKRFKFTQHAKKRHGHTRVRYIKSPCPLPPNIEAFAAIEQGCDALKSYLDPTTINNPHPEYNKTTLLENAMRLAAISKNPNVIQLLREHGANLNQLSRFTHDPLIFYMIDTGNVEGVYELKRLGADLTLRGISQAAYGKTPLEHVTAQLHHVPATPYFNFFRSKFLEIKKVLEQ